MIRPNRTAPILETMIDRADLSDLLEMRYGIRVSAVTQRKSVYGIVSADQRRFVWKFASWRDDEMRLRCLVELAERLRPCAIPVSTPLPSQDGMLLTRLGDGTGGYLLPWLPGRHVNLKHRQQRVSALATVAHLHVCTHRWPALYSGHLYPSAWMGAKLRLKRTTLRRLWPVARQQHPALERIEDDVFAVVDDCVRQMENPFTAYPWQPHVAEDVAFCHRDLAPHNLLWTRGPAATLIDFDLSGADDPLSDVVQLANHIVFVADPAPGWLDELVAVYKRIRPLTSDREEQLWRLLKFPDILIRTLAEWGKADFSPDWRQRINFAIEKEQVRWRVWAADYPQSSHRPVTA